MKGKVMKGKYYGLVSTQCDIRSIRTPRLAGSRRNQGLRLDVHTSRLRVSLGNLLEIMLNYALWLTRGDGATDWRDEQAVEGTKWGKKAWLLRNEQSGEALTKAENNYENLY